MWSCWLQAFTAQVRTGSHTKYMPCYLSPNFAIVTPVSNINVSIHPEHPFHWGAWAPHKKIHCFKKGLLWGNCWYILVHFFCASFESTSHLKSVMSRTVAISFSRAPKADFMSFSFLLDFFQYWSFYRAQFPCHPFISPSILVLVRIQIHLSQFFSIPSLCIWNTIKYWPKKANLAGLEYCIS